MITIWLQYEVVSLSTEVDTGVCVKHLQNYIPTKVKSVESCKEYFAISVKRLIIK